MDMKKKKNKIIAAGHICLDISPHFSSTENRPISEILSPGKLINMEGVTVHTGGSVANTGLALKKLGNDVCVISKIGKDSFGEMLLNELEKYNVNMNISSSENSRTSYSIVISIPNVDRIFLHDAGANSEFNSKDIDFKELEDAQIFHFGYPPLMREVYDNDGFELVKIFKKAKELGVITSLDTVAIDPSSHAGKADWFKIIQNVLPYVDYFMPSVEELAFMINRPLYDSWIKHSNEDDIIKIINIEEEVTSLANTLLSIGAKNILIKCGSKGMYFKNKDIEIFEESFLPKKLVSATGAGDTSIAAFLTGLINNETINDCLKLACATGATCVENFDSLSNIHSIEKIRERINSGWEKQRIELVGDWKYDTKNQFWFVHKNI